MRFWIGGYTADMGGSALGIGQLVVGAPEARIASGALRFSETVAPADSPSWLAAHSSEPVIYAALEQRGIVQAFRRTGNGALAPFGSAVPVAAAVCHLAVDDSSVWATCWNEGQVFRIPTGTDGSLGAPRLLASAADPHAVALGLGDAGIADEVRPSRGHQTAFLPGGLTVTIDMGLDLVRFWSGERQVQQVVLPKGAGPRHAVWHPSGHLYVVTELSLEVFVLAADRSGAWQLVAGTPLAPTMRPGVDFAAGITLSEDARFVYAGVRGSDAIAVLRVQDGGARLTSVALESSQVEWPRFHTVYGDTLFVAGQNSNEIVSIALDERAGTLGAVRHRVQAPSPVAMLLA